MRPKKITCASDRVLSSSSDTGSFKIVGEIDEGDLNLLVNSETGVRLENDGLNVNFHQTGEFTQFNPGECQLLPSGSVRCEFLNPFGGGWKAKFRAIKARPPAVRFATRHFGIPAVECGPGPASVRILYGPIGLQTIHSASLATCEQRGIKTICTP